MDFDRAAVGEIECRAEVDLAHQFKASLAVELAGAAFVRVGADDQAPVSSDETTLKFDGFAELGLPIVGVLVRKDEGVGGDDVFLGDADVESAGDELDEANAGFDERHDGIQVGSGQAVAGGNVTEEGLHTLRENSTSAVDSAEGVEEELKIAREEKAARGATPQADWTK